MRTKQCTATIRKGRLRKALQFANTARGIETDMTLIDAYVTNCIHAGIAAADVICCAQLGEHAVGENHQDAVEHLAKADGELAKDLRALLAMKTAAGYSEVAATEQQRKRARRAMDRLLEVAEQEG